MSYIPSKEWLLSEERNFPVIIDPDIYIYNNIHTSTLSETYPTAYINDDILKIGGCKGSRYGALISLPSSSFLFSNDYITITDAKLHVYFRNHDYSTLASGLELCALLSSYMPYWASVSSEFESRVERFNVKTYSYNSLDITSIAASWQNYYRSGSKVGVYPYGFTIKPYVNTCTMYEADAATGINSPYYTLTYKTDTNYTLTYSPNKYKNIVTNDKNAYNDIYNFESRMNCYAYAMQIYHQTNNQNFTEHRLMPGEIGMSLNSAFNTSTQLRNHYINISTDDEFINFTEQQMMLDSAKMNTNLQRITLSNEEQFVLPTGYNESKQRIIAMCTGKGSGYLSNRRDFHFYLRHGNGTCTEHRGTCSIWSYKSGNGFVFNKINDTIICDRNIASLSKQLKAYSDLSGSTYTLYNSPVRFYTIEQDTNVYNSWYEYNSTRDTVSYID